LHCRSEHEEQSKRVQFGSLLSPELFDETLSPSNPVKKGATPKRVLVGALTFKQFKNQLFKGQLIFKLTLKQSVCYFIHNRSE
jgi:hypothetical protein